MTPGMPGGGPRYREAMVVWAALWLLQDSGLRPRVGDGPGTTPKLPALGGVARGCDVETRCAKSPYFASGL